MENIIEKIKKCFALGSSNFKAEAETALRMAKNLMNQHGLQMADIEWDSKSGKIHVRKIGI